MIWLRILLLVGLFVAGWYSGSDHIQRKWDEATARRVAEQLAKNQADHARLNKLEVAKNENIVEIDRLRANNHALWLRLPKTACGGSSSPIGNTTAGDGELPTQSESYLAEAKRQLDDEAHRADAIVEGCRVLNEFVK